MGFMMLRDLLAATVGVAMFWGLTRVGCYYVILPGCLVGVIAACFPPPNHWASDAIRLAIAGSAGLVADWTFAPFTADGSLIYFCLHLHRLSAGSLASILVGGIVGLCLGRFRSRPKGPVQTLR